MLYFLRIVRAGSGVDGRKGCCLRFWLGLWFHITGVGGVEGNALDAVVEEPG